MARMHDHLVVELEQAAKRGLQVGEIGMARRARAADRAVEEHVAGEDVGALDQEGEVAAGMAGRRDRPHLHARDIDRAVFLERVRDLAVEVAVLADQLDRAGARPGLDAVAVQHLIEVVDVVDVVVGQDHALDREVVLLDEAVQVVVRAVAVDPECGAAPLLGDDVRVGHPLGVLGVVDQHGEPPTRSGW